MLYRGIPFSPMVFVSFVGASVAMNRRPQDAWEDALVGLGGRILGSVGALGCSLGAHAMYSQHLFALADFAFFINFLNLLPIGMMGKCISRPDSEYIIGLTRAHTLLDGGRITGAISPYAGDVGLGLGGMFINNGIIQKPIIFLVVMAGGWQTYERFSNPNATPGNYYNISLAQRVALTGGHFGLVGALFAATALNNEFRKPSEVLEQEKSWDES